MEEKQTKKRMINKQLVSYLMDVKGIDLISINQHSIICTVGAKFKPSRINDIMTETGNKSVRMMSEDGNNYIIFKRR